MTITAYEFVGTNSLFDIGGQGVPSLLNLYQVYGQLQLALAGTVLGNSLQTTTFMGSALNPALYTHVLVPYPAAFFWVGQSVDTGVTNGINLINSTPGEFILFGWSQGAIVASDLLDEVTSGSLTSRASDFLGGATFGNLRRESGHTFPLCPDPGGEGALANDLLEDTPTSWFDFAINGDDATCNDPSSVEGQAITALCELLMLQQAGTQAEQATLNNFLSAPVFTLIDSFLGAASFLYSIGVAPSTLGVPVGPLPLHLTYGTNTPLTPADSRTCAQIGVDYFHALALGWNAATVAPVAAALGGGDASFVVAEPTLSGSYGYTVNAFNVTASTQSTTTLSGPPVVSDGNVTLIVTGLTVGDAYTFSVTLSTSFSNPPVTPTSMASNQITIT